MDNYTNNGQKEILRELLANPADAGHNHLQTLQQLVQEYPQSGILQVLLARADDSRDAAGSAVYYNPKALYKIINNPWALATVDETAIIQRHIKGNKETNNVEYIPAEETFNPVVNEDKEQVIEAPEMAAVADPQPEFEQADTRLADSLENEAGPAEYEEVTDWYEKPVALPLSEQFPETASAQIAETPAEVYFRPEGLEEPINNEPQTEEHVQTSAEEALSFTALDMQPEKEFFRQDIEDEIYDEIVSIDDIGFKAVNKFSEPVQSSDIDQSPVTEILATIPQDNDTEDLPLAEDSTADKGYDEAVTGTEARLAATGEIETSISPALQTQEGPTTDNQDVSRYYDDTLPYSFMWWLNKTRKEHAGSFQPYAGNKQNTGQPPVKPRETDELQQQYNENIFSTTSVNSIGSNPLPVVFDHEKKEDVIIERFIHTEPQIKPLAADKLDNENKARQSAEDHNELVTETLARIYTEQMLYPKAIVTYQKLMLKYPEKNAYFAAQIQLLEKRTN